MAKKRKKTPKKLKKKPEKKVTEVKEIILEEKPESEVEEKIQEAEEEAENKKFAEFTISPESTTPVLEKIAQAPEIETQGWEMKTPESSRKEEKPKSEYEFLEKTIEYKSQEAKAPVLTRRQEIDIQSIGRERTSVGREFQMQAPEELQSKSREYEPETVVMQRGFEPTKKTKEKIGRDYTPKREIH